MLIRSETPADSDAIHALTVLAFKTMPFSKGAEAPIIRQLRKDGDLTLSLVAEEDGTIIGHVAFSPVCIDGETDNWFGLGPISVVPDRQRQGIGSKLVEEGLKQLRKMGAAGCALIGSPDVYHPMGFESGGALSYGTLDRKLVHWTRFGDEAPSGELTFAAAFHLDI